MKEQQKMYFTVLSKSKTIPEKKSLKVCYSQLDFAKLYEKPLHWSSEMIAILVHYNSELCFIFVSRSATYSVKS